ncbi:hypothetical protein FQR65_LT05611 [Abscondita terminalis]|nr:hypothetical protein FQR65_LT05611 [Abscondita terminalis]
MIAAKDPQEFIPSGRQQLLNHPGPNELYNNQQDGFSSEILRTEFEKVSINGSTYKEWWAVRKSVEQHEKSTNKEHNIKNCFEEDYTNCQNTSENSWTWKNVDASRIHKRLSDVQGSKKRKSNEAELMNDKVHKSNVHGYLKCQNLGVMEEELYVKDNVVIWSKGTTSSRNSIQTDNSRVTICSYTSEYPVRHALWCTFYCELPSFININQNFNSKVDEPQGIPMPSICIVDSHNLKVFSTDSEDFVTSLPFLVGGLWNTKFGIILERDKNSCKKFHEEDGPTVFSMIHPLDEVSPVAIVQGSIRLIEDYSASIVYTSDNPSICMMYDSHTFQHSVYAIRKVRNEDRVSMSSFFILYFTLMFIAKNKLSMWDVRSETPSSFTSRPASINVHTHSQQQSRSQSPMATISRCQSPTISPLVSSNPWLPKLSRIHNSLRFGNTPASLALSSSQIDVADDYHYVNPLLCFEHIWTDSFTTQDNAGPASKAFLIDDLVGRSYLCYLIPSRLQLSMICVERPSPNVVTFGLLTSISAKDAVPIPHLHMLAILEYSGSIVLYSGLTAVGKLHVGGVLAQHVLSPCMARSFSHFNSPFPRRSTLLPHYSTPVSNPNFDEHLLSPVLPTGSASKLPIILDPYQIRSETGRAQLNGLRDAIADRITLQYSDGTYYRITLPPIATSALIENCLNALRQVLSRDSTMTL